MKISRILGVLSFLMFIFAVLSMALPCLSAVTGLKISINQLSASSGTLPTSMKVTNHGFLAIDNVYVSVNLVSSGGTVTGPVKLGPANIPPGAAVPLNIVSTLNGLVNTTA